MLCHATKLQSRCRCRQRPKQHSAAAHKAIICADLLVCLQLGRIETTKEPKLQPYASEDSQGLGVPGPAGGQFGQQWDEQQYPPMQPAYNYGDPDDLSQVPYLSSFLLSYSSSLLAAILQPEALWHVGFFSLHWVIKPSAQYDCPVHLGKALPKTLLP